MAIKFRHNALDVAQSKITGEELSPTFCSTLVKFRASALFVMLGGFVGTGVLELFDDKIVDYWLWLWLTLASNLIVLTIAGIILTRAETKRFYEKNENIRS